MSALLFFTNGRLEVEVFIKKVISAVIGSTLLIGVTSTAALAYSGEQYVICNLNPQGDNFLALRTCGSSRCDMLMKLPPDTFLMTMEPTSVRGWREVMVIKGLQDQSYSGPAGWVYGKYICKIRY